MSLPLNGFRVLDLTAVVSGPMATCILSDQGADVIKVEPLGVGDLTRVLGSERGGVTSLYETINRGKRSIALNLKHQRGRELLLQLAGTADLFVENFRPGALARLGLSHEDVSLTNQEIIYVSISGFGPDGPYSKSRVYDAIIQAVSGLAAIQGNPEIGKPELVRNLICDKVTALTAAQAMTAALLNKVRTGKGCHISLSMLDASVAFLWPDGFGNEMFLEDPRVGEAELTPRGNNNYRPHPTRDGAVTLMAVSNKDFADTCRALDLDEMIDDPAFSEVRARRLNSTQMTTRFADALAKLDTETVLERMVEEGAPCARVNDRLEVAEDPQVRHNGIVVRMDHPRAGRIAVARGPAVFDGVASSIAWTGPQLGEHTEPILKDLGIGAAELEDLRTEGIVG